MLFIFEMFRRRRHPEPTPETPPALVIPEQQLRDMYRLGVIAGYKQRKEEEEQTNRARISSLKTLKPQPAQSVVSMPTQRVQEPVQRPIPINSRAGGWMHTERARQRTAAKLKQQIIPVRPKFYNIPTEAEHPIIRRNWPDAG